MQFSGTTVVELNKLRHKIEALDEELLSCLARRRELALLVAKDKAERQNSVRDTGREASLLLKLMEKGTEIGLDPAYLSRLYHIIIEDSVLTQQAFMQQGDTRGALSVSHLGMPGTYSHLAAQSYANRRQCAFNGYACETFEEVISHTETGKTALGMLPIENTTSGSINEVYDLLRHTHLYIVGESYLKVDHHLLVKSGVDLNQVHTVYSHPQALTQCSKYLQRLTNVNYEACASSAHAMQKVAESEDPGVAAIGSQSGGALYDLIAIDRELANQKDNQTRFIVVSRDPVHVPQQLPAKTSLIMATHNKPGALVDALTTIRNHDLNMSKLESRPMPGNPWEELFYVDLAANESDLNWQAAYRELEATTRFVKVLGCYPDEQVKATNPPIPVESD